MKRNLVKFRSPQFKKRGQAAMEYLLVASLILLVFVPSTILFFTNIKKSTDDLAVAKIYKVGNEIVNTATEVYYQGEPAKITLKESMPDGLLNISLIQDWTRTPPINELIFTLVIEGNEQDLSFKSDVNINGTFSEESRSKGIKNIVLEAETRADGTPFVNISIS
jgi:uncharacterized protein (UPF0333 family)